MAPIMEPDFDWTDVEASPPMHKKGEYLLAIKKVTGAAWYKTDAQGNSTGEVVKRVRFTPEVVGAYDSRGNLQTEVDGKEIAGSSAQGIDGWAHSQGGREMLKGYMMAILGYNSQRPDSERSFNEFIKTNNLDLKVVVEEREDGEGLTLVLGEGWKIFEGKNVRAAMRVGSWGTPPQERQEYDRLSPVNKE